MSVVQRLRCPLLLALAAGLLPLSAAAQLPPEQLLVLDQDAHPLTEFNLGAVYNVRLADPPTTEPALVVGADAGAPLFEFVTGIAISPVDGRAYVTDAGQFADDTADGRVYAISPDGSVQLISDDPLLIDPFDLTFLADGTLVVADWEADPFSLGPDLFGGDGHGALLGIDEGTGEAWVLSAGLDHTVPRPPGVGIGDSIFNDPIGVAYDRVSDLLYVVDFSIDWDGNGAPEGGVFAVSPYTGTVSLISDSPSFLAPVAIAVRADGKPVVVDAIVDDSILFEIDPDIPDRSDNVESITRGTQYKLLDGVAVDEVDDVYVTDVGEYFLDPVSGMGTFISDPGVFRVDESRRDVDPDWDHANKVPVLAHDPDLDTIVAPVALATVPVPRLTAVSEQSILEPTVVALEGEHLITGMGIDTGGLATFSALTPLGGFPVRSALGTTITPGPPVSVPADGCPGWVDLVVSHPFGGSSVLERAFAIAATSTGEFSPAPPSSPFGDASGDQIVDGIDLAILGRAFGTEYCDGAPFVNDADFNDDDVIDGSDLAVLASFFGSRP